MLAYVFFFLFPFLMIYACFTDLFEMTISNKVSLALIVGFVVFAFMIGMSLETVLWHFAMFAVVLLGGFSLFAFNIIGGGDAKLAASTALWLGWGFVAPYLVVASILGGVLTLAMLKFRSHLLPEKLSEVAWINRLHNKDNGVPYGIALGISAILVYPQTPWTKHILQMTSAM